MGHEQTCAAPEEGEIARADPPAGPGEQPDEGGVRPGVLEDLADGDEVGHLGQVQQTGETHHLHGDVAGDECALDLGEVGGGAAQDGDLGGCLSGAYEMGDRVGEPVDLLGVGAQQRAAHQAVPLGSGGGPQGLHARVHGAQRLREAVGEVEEAAAAAAVLTERLAGRGAAVGAREVLGEVVEVGHGGAAPAVDRLAGVAHRGHGVPRAAAEQSGEQDALGHRRVLVLVQQDDPELVAQDLPDLGTGAGQGGGEGDLVAEVEEVAFAFGRAVAAHQLGEFTPGGGGLGDLAQVRVGEFGALQGAEQFGVVGAQVLCPYEVFGELGVECQEVADQVREGAGQRRIRARGLTQHPGGELVAGGVGEQPGGRFEPDAQAVVGEQAAREGVVRGDDRFARRVVGVDDVRVSDARLDQRLADALGEFARRLVGERQAEDLLGGDLSGADQPHHACRHHRGLARTGSGHDHLRGGRCGDALRLLRGERDTEELLELLGVGDTGGHVAEASGAR